MDFNIELAHDRIVEVLMPLAEEQKLYLKRVKQEAIQRIDREDLIWYELLSSMATMGNERGYIGLICTQENYRKVTFEALSQIAIPDNRLRILEITLIQAKVRYPNRKAAHLSKNFEIIKQMGGLSSTKEMLFNLKGRDEKIRFLGNFHGISDKYARNMMMDICHPEFYDSIAIDSRIESISRELGLSVSNLSYIEHEKFYLSVAKSLKLRGWELDRLMFKTLFEILCNLRKLS